MCPKHWSLLLFRIPWTWLYMQFSVLAMIWVVTSTTGYVSYTVKRYNYCYCRKPWLICNKAACHVPKQPCCCRLLVRYSMYVIVTPIRGIRRKIWIYWMTKKWGNCQICFRVAYWLIFWKEMFAIFISDFYFFRVKEYIMLLMTSQN